MKSQRIAGRSVRRRGQALIISMVVCVVIIMLMMLKYLGPTQNSDGSKGPSVIKQSQDRGSEVQTNIYLGQIRQLIGIYRSDNGGKAPASYEELRRAGKDYPPEMWVNAVDKKPFVYDPATGTIDVDGAMSRSAERVNNASQANNSDPAQAAPPADSAAPGVPNPSDIVGKIPQPGGNLPADDQ